MENETKTNMRSESKPCREGTRLLFAGGTVSLTMCPADEKQKDKKKVRRKTSQDEGRDKADKNRSRP